MSNVKRISVLCLTTMFVTFLATIATAQPPAPDEPKTAEEVLAKMSEARSAIRSASYEIRLKTHYAIPVRGVPADTVAVHKLRFWVYGERYRYEDDGPIPGPDGLVAHKKTWVFDGVRRWYYLPHVSAATTEQGARLDQYFCKPLMDFHFGLLTDQRFRGGDLLFEGKHNWHGRTCYVLKEMPGPRCVRFWIDLGRDWTLARETWNVVAPEKHEIWDDRAMIWRGFSLSEIEWEVSYEKHSSGIWHPAGWTRRLYAGRGDKRELQTIETARVTEVALNIELEPSTFTIELPDGTEVYDEEKEVSYLWDSTMTPENRAALIEAKVRERDAREQAYLQRIESRLKVGDMAPAYDVQTTDGDELRFADYRGKFLLLVFWSQCVDGRREAPHLDAAFKSFLGDNRFAMVCLHSAMPIKRQHAEEFIAQNQLGWQVAFVDEVTLRDLREKYGVSYRDWVFLIGPDGKLIARNLRGDAIKAAVAEALGGQ